MTQPQGEPQFVKSDWDSITGIRRFSYEAMATTFEVIILHEDARYAEQAQIRFQIHMPFPCYSAARASIPQPACPFAAFARFHDESLFSDCRAFGKSRASFVSMKPPDSG